MPGGDRTGPAGAGPMTGRGAGYCGGGSVPGYANPAARLGLARGFRGGARGWRHMFQATGLRGWARGGLGYTPLSSEQELSTLKSQADSLKDQLEAINKRIEEIGKA